MIDIKKLIEDYLGSPAPEDWNTNPNYRISLYDAEQLIQQALQKCDCDVKHIVKHSACHAGVHNFQVLHYGLCKKCNSKEFRAN